MIEIWLGTLTYPDWPSWIRPPLLVAIALWALGLYWGFSPINDRMVERLSQWLSFDREAALSSVISLLGFLGVAVAIVYLTQISLGGSWAVSWGVIMCMGGGVYELGRRDSASRAARQDQEAQD